MADKHQHLVWEMGVDHSVFRTPIFEVCVFETVNPRNGVKAEFYKLKCPEWVNVVAVTEAGELVLVHQFRHGSRRVELEIPAGLMERGESPVDAGARELLEETGYEPLEPGKILVTFHPNAAFQENVCHAVLFERVRKTRDAAPEALEALETVTLPVDDVKRALADGRISHGTIAVSIFHYLLRRNML